VKKDSPYKVKVTMGDANVEIEGQESGVVKIVEALGAILRPSRKLAAPDNFEPIPQGLTSSKSVSSSLDIRSFFNSKQPATDVEAAAVTAYFYKYVAPENDRRESINSNVLQEAFRMARRPLPKVVRYTLQNARNAGYLDTTGGGGEYRLNAVGYNLVEHTLGQAQEPIHGPKPRRSKSTHR
jgi:hypothetical protein